MVIVSSCKTTDTATTSKKSEKKQEVSEFANIVKQQPAFYTMTTKCNISIDKIKSKAQIKMINGEYLQISVQPLLGIEMLRLMMTKDTLYIVDKINSMVAVEPLNSLTDKLPKGVGLKELQKIFIGTQFLPGDTLTTANFDDFKWEYSSSETKMTNQLNSSASISFINDKQGVLKSTTIEYNSQPVIVCEYSQNRVDAQGALRPSNLTIKPNLPVQQINLPITVTGISPEWNKRVVIDTNVSSRYKRTSLIELLENYIK